MRNSIFHQELMERFHRVPLDEPEPCLDCGREANGGLYLAGEVRPLCTTSHTHFTQSEHGKRLAEALQAFNALGTNPPKAEAKRLQEHAARQLADWLDLRRAERAHTGRAAP